MSNCVRTALCCLFLTVGCEDPPKKAPVVAPVDQPTTPPTTQAPPARRGPPDLAIDTISPKVGYERQNFDYPDGRAKLAQALAAERAAFEGQTVNLIVDRKAKQEWVAAYLAELGKIGVPAVRVKTETRKEFPAELIFTPEQRLAASPSCSPVAMILEDRATAVWKLAGGAAGRRPKGMAGPDLSMTGDSIERVGKACKTGAVLFVAAANTVEWGLVYDLAASTKTLNVHFEAIGFLGTAPVPGHKVALAR